MRTVLLLMFMTLLSAASKAQTGESLSTFDNQYTAKLYGFHIDARSRLSLKKNDLYEFYFNASSLVGDVTETTELKWDAKEQLTQPQAYFYKRNGLGKNRDDQLLFDWAKLIVTNVKRDTHTPLDAAKKIQDSLSYQIQLRQDLIAGKKKMQYNISNGGKLRQYDFEVAGEEYLKTPLGEVLCVKVMRERDSDSETIAWFAKDFQYLLVRLQKEENGSAYTIYLSKASLDGKVITHF